MTRYEEDRLHCLRCKEQPEYFHEAMAWQVNRVTPDGSMIEQKDGEVLEYTCPECHGPAEWGHDIKDRGETSPKKGRG